MSFLVRVLQSDMIQFTFLLTCQEAEPVMTGRHRLFVELAPDTHDTRVLMAAAWIVLSSCLLCASTANDEKKPQMKDPNAQVSILSLIHI